MVLSHGVTIQRNERQATTMNVEKLMAGSGNGSGAGGGSSCTNKIRTKGRFHIGIPTNGQLNKTDTAWAQKANPTAHAAQLHRDQLDIKMLQKKKKSRELSNMLVSLKCGSTTSSSKKLIL